MIKVKKQSEKKHFNVITVMFFLRYKSKFDKHFKYCTGGPGFIYCFQNESLETYEKFLKHKKDFPFTVAGDLETTTGI